MRFAPVVPSVTQLPRLSPLEVSAGLVLRLAPEPQDVAPSRRSPAEALEAAVAPALRCHPCLVSFSGGVDSSLVLAAAVRGARKLGLDPPVPVTWRFAEAPRADERIWQERVIGELGLTDWERLEAGHELDLIGPVAQSVLTRHGVEYPANRHLHVPLLERARGGALLTGVGGDQVLGPGWWRQAARVRAQPRLPTAREAAHLALASAPVPVRVRLDPRRARLESPWLRREARADAAARFAAIRAREPMRWDARVRWQPRRGDLAAQLVAFEQLGIDAGTRVVMPLVDPGFLDSVASAGGRRGFASRLAAVTALLGEIVPATVLERRSKAAFDEVFWGPRARTAARGWDGDGVDPELVDVVALKSIWGGDQPPARTGLLLQQVWLSRMRACG